MKLNIEKAFSFPFTDSNWIKKLLIGGVFYFIPNMISSFIRFISNISKIGIKEGYFHPDPNTYIVLIIGIFILMLISLAAIIILPSFPIGYTLQSMHNEIKDETPLLPCWDSKFKDYFLKGIKYIFIEFIYGLIAGLLLIIPVLIGISAYFLYKDNQTIYITGIALSIALATVIILFYAFILPYVQASYAENFNFSDAFKVGRILKLISKAVREYLEGILFLFLLILMVSGISFMLCITCVGILFIPFLTLPSRLISSNLFAQAYKAALQNSQSI